MSMVQRSAIHSPKRLRLKVARGFSSGSSKSVVTEHLGRHRRIFHPGCHTDIDMEFARPCPTGLPFRRPTCPRRRLRRTPHRRSHRHLAVYRITSGRDKGEVTYALSRGFDHDDMRPEHLVRTKLTAPTNLRGLLQIMARNVGQSLDKTYFRFHTQIDTVGI